jgi:hypothetical protein
VLRSSFALLGPAAEFPFDEAKAGTPPSRPEPGVPLIRVMPMVVRAAPSHVVAPESTVAPPSTEPIEPIASDASDCEPAAPEALLAHAQDGIASATARTIDLFMLSFG